MVGENDLIWFRIGKDKGTFKRKGSLVCQLLGACLPIKLLSGTYAHVPKVYAYGLESCLLIV